MTHTPEQHLAAAKEALRKEFNHFICFEWSFDDVGQIADEEFNEILDFFHTKLTNQAKELEAELKELRLALITRDGNLTNKILKEENDHLKSELSKSTEEKARMQSTIDEWKVRHETVNEAFSNSLKF